MTKRKHSGEMPVFPPAVTRQIVDGMFTDREAMLVAMEKLGYDREDVLQHAFNLGLSVQFIELCRLTGDTPKLRRCLSCEREFVSLGPQNRMCRRCRRD
jgi:hypothetical protein